MYCRTCGNLLQGEQSHCLVCNVGPGIKSEKSYGVSVALCGVFGVFGIHHFYLKNWLHGSVDLVLSIVGFWFIFLSTDPVLNTIGVLAILIDLIHTITIMYWLFTGQCRDGDGLLVLYPGQRA